MKRILGLFLVLFSLSAACARAEGTRPLQISVWSPVQLFSADDSIFGLRVSALYSDNYAMSGLSVSPGWTRTADDMKGIQLGMVNWTDRSLFGWETGFLNYAGNRFSGMEIGAVNIVKDNATGIQLGAVNCNSSFFHGWQVGGLFNYTGDNSVGVQIGLINLVKRDFSGFQTGFMNHAGGHMTGLQIGCFNYAQEVHGVQIGVFNITDSLNGVQLGLGNNNRKSEVFPYTTVLNCAF